MALSREPTMNPESQRKHSPAFFLVLLCAIVVVLAAFIFLKSINDGNAAKPVTNGMQQTAPASSK